jgi:hypothetical protein
MSVERRCEKFCIMVPASILREHRTTCEGPKPKYRTNTCPECGVQTKLRRSPCCWQCEVKDSEFDWATLDRKAKSGAITEADSG